MTEKNRTPSDWARSRAAEHLFGDNLPSGAEAHIDRLATLLDEVRLDERSAIVAYGRRRSDHFCSDDIGLDTVMDEVECGEHTIIQGASQ